LEKGDPTIPGRTNPGGKKKKKKKKKLKANPRKKQTEGGEGKDKKGKENFDVKPFCGGSGPPFPMSPKRGGVVRKMAVKKGKRPGTGWNFRNLELLSTRGNKGNQNVTLEPRKKFFVPKKKKSLRRSLRPKGGRKGKPKPKKGSSLKKGGPSTPTLNVVPGEGGKQPLWSWVLEKGHCSPTVWIKETGNRKVPKRGKMWGLSPRLGFDPNRMGGGKGRAKRWEGPQNSLKKNWAMATTQQPGVGPAD